MATYSKEQVIATLDKYKFIPLFYHADLDISINIIRACFNGGVRLFEYTNRGENAKANFAKIMEFVAAECPGMVMGIGTVLSAQDCEEFIAMGANFVVTPILSPEVGDVCKKHNVVWVPGVMTPTEIYAAIKAGADFQKLFPGDILHPAYVKAIRGPLPFAKLIITGGVMPTIDSVSQWLSCGAICVGLGSHLFSKDSIAKGDYADIELRVGRLVKAFVHD